LPHVDDEKKSTGTWTRREHIYIAHATDDLVQGKSAEWLAAENIIVVNENGVDAVTQRPEGWNNTKVPEMSKLRAMRASSTEGTNILTRKAPCACSECMKGEFDACLLSLHFRAWESTRLEPRPFVRKIKKAKVPQADAHVVQMYMPAVAQGGGQGFYIVAIPAPLYEPEHVAFCLVTVGAKVATAGDAVNNALLVGANVAHSIHVGTHWISVKLLKRKARGALNHSNYELAQAVGGDTKVPLVALITPDRAVARETWIRASRVDTADGVVYQINQHDRDSILDLVDE